MTFTDVMYWLGDCFEYCFKLLKWLGNNHLNLIFLIIGFIATGIWFKMQADYNRKAKEQNTLK